MSSIHLSYRKKPRRFSHPDVQAELVVILDYIKRHHADPHFLRSADANIARLLRLAALVADEPAPTYHQTQLFA